MTENDSSAKHEATAEDAAAENGQAPVERLASARLDGYLNRFRQRLRQLTRSRGAAAIALAAALITVVAVFVAIRSGFPDSLMISARIALLAAIGGLAWLVIVRPNRRLQEHGAGQVEDRTPAFAGRVTTYAGMRDSGNPMRELLAEDALHIANAHAPEAQVPRREFALPIGLATAAVGAIVLLGTLGQGNYGYGVRDLWLGWAFPNVAPPQSIEVSPGNDGIRAGGTVRVRATMQGFAPPEAWVYARFGDDAWQQVEMAERGEAFEFTFFSVREPLEYYVSTGNVRSPSFEIAVVDLPNIDRLTNTYTFPDWTGREPDVQDPGGDVRAVVDTDIEVAITGSDDLTPGVLIVDDEEIPLTIDGTDGRASFTVDEDGQYYVAATVGGERIRLTDDYFISVVDDTIPEIQFTKPGRDWSASPIEEVTARIQASDDFLVESLELFYSVNGGEWNSLELTADEQQTEAEHVFYLESLLDDQTPAVDLVPGDLVSYYAVAEDRSSSARTDIFFVDVQPFDRRYTQSQMSGGGQQGGGNQQDEISQRQREIIVSTWNLIREQQEDTRDDDTYVPNNAALLSRLQATLREQAQTLAERTRARMLTASDEKIAGFVENLDLAADAMVPASELLGDIKLEEAILPAQEALQHLLRAEAVFTDISLSMQANNRGGGGGQAGRDLTDMFELEMDLEKNQYETGSRATPDAPQQQQLDEIGNELEELARRQEQLAQRLDRERQASPAERWQQDLLRREAEELRERLERMQQQASNQQAQQNSQQSGSSSSQSSGEPSPGQPSSGQPSSGDPSSGQPSEQQSAANQNDENGGEREMDQLRRRLDSAVRAMNEADQAMRKGGDPEASQRAAAEAQRQLEGAREQADAERARLLQAELGELGERAEDAYESQVAMEEKLQDAIRGMLEDDGNDNRLDSGLTFAEEMEMAAEKRRLQSELQGIEQAANRTANELSASNQQAADELNDALAELRDQEVDARLAIAAAYIEQGEAVYVSGSESAVTESLREFTQSMRRAQVMAANDEPGNGGGEQNGVAETLAEIQALRRALQQMSEASGTDQGQATGTGRDDLQRSSGEFVPDIDTARALERDGDDVSDEVMNQFNELRAGGLPDEAIDELRRLASDVRASDFSGNEALLERESRAALNLVEQLELAFSRAARSQDANVRATPAETVPVEHRKPVANYYRRLGEANDGGDNDDE